MPAASAPTRRRSGSPASELSSAQRDLLWQMIELYSVEHLPARLPTRSGRASNPATGEAVHFAWYGPNTPEKAFGYRVIGDGFVIEMASVDPEAQHLHTIYHDLECAGAQRLVVVVGWAKPRSGVPASLRRSGIAWARR